MFPFKNKFFYDSFEFLSDAIFMWSYKSIVFRLFSLTNAITIKTMAAKPSKTGTNTMIHVGWSTQFDSISQNYWPINFRQHPPLQIEGSSHSDMQLWFFLLIIIKLTKI